MARRIVAVSGTPDGLGQGESQIMYVAWLGIIGIAGLLLWATVQPPKSSRRG
jgi:hypothetical protein